MDELFEFLSKSPPHPLESRQSVELPDDVASVLSASFVTSSSRFADKLVVSPRRLSKSHPTEQLGFRA